MESQETESLREKHSALERHWEPALRAYAALLGACVTARLTGPRDERELYDLHVLDCLYSVPLLPPSGDVIDVGSGGGLPGMVWAICRPDLPVTLLDSARKKCRAMEEIASALGLRNVSVVWARVEEHALAARETYTVAAARALTRAGVLAEYLAPLVRSGGTLWAFKGPKAEEELQPVGGRWAALGLAAPETVPYGPETRSHCFIMWKKIAPCPRGYPRKPGTALMKDWWL